MMLLRTRRRSGVMFLRRVENCPIGELTSGGDVLSERGRGIRKKTVGKKASTSTS